MQTFSPYYRITPVSLTANKQYADLYFMYHMLWSCALWLVFISLYEVRWRRESDRRCVDSDCVCCTLQAVQVTHLRNFYLHHTEESEREESGEQRTTENKQILFVCEKNVKYATISFYCDSSSDKWNRWHANIKVFQCFKVSEDELMPNLCISYFYLDETVAAVST